MGSFVLFSLLRTQYQAGICVPQPQRQWVLRDNWQLRSFSTSPQVLQYLVAPLLFKAWDPSVDLGNHYLCISSYFRPLYCPPDLCEHFCLALGTSYQGNAALMVTILI